MIVQERPTTRGQSAAESRVATALANPTTDALATPVIDEERRRFAEAVTVVTKRYLAQQPAAAELLAVAQQIKQRLRYKPEATERFYETITAPLFRAFTGNDTFAFR